MRNSKIIAFVGAITAILVFFYQGFVLLWNLFNRSIYDQRSRFIENSFQIGTLLVCIWLLFYLRKRIGAPGEEEIIDDDEELK